MRHPNTFKGLALLNVYMKKEGRKRKEENRAEDEREREREMNTKQQQTTEKKTHVRRKKQQTRETKTNVRRKKLVPIIFPRQQELWNSAANPDPPRTRTWNLRLRRPTPYPLGQRAITFFSLKEKIVHSLCSYIYIYIYVYAVSVYISTLTHTYILYIYL